MPRSSYLLGATLGAVSSLALMGLLYLGRQVAGIPFLPFDLFEWLTRALPGALVTFFIDTMVSGIRLLRLGQTADVAKTTEQLSALILGLVIGALCGVLLVWLRQERSWSGYRPGLVVAVLVLLLAVALEVGVGALVAPLAWLLLAAIIGAWGIALAIWVKVTLLRTSERDGSQYFAGRRAFLTKVIAGALAAALGAWGLGRLLEEQGTNVGANQPLPVSPILPPATANTPAPFETPYITDQPPAPGTRAALTATNDFYRVDIDLFEPTINGSAWTLKVGGLFANPHPVTLADLMAYPAVMEPITLSCISNPIGGDLIGNAYWTGMRLRDLLRDLVLQPTAKELYVEAADGFFESVAMQDMLDPRTLLVYGMSGVSLPVEHGFPLRILVPNRYGMKQPKWITGIEAIDVQREGYWVERGWSKEAHPHVLSIIDTIVKDKPVGNVPIGGIAWAGDRGIQKVEVQTDNGPWQQAALLPSLGPLAWVQWRFEWVPVAGRHVLRVRATDGAGTVQDGQTREPHPNGATGYHSITVDAWN